MATTINDKRQALGEAIPEGTGVPGLPAGAVVANPLGIAPRPAPVPRLPYAPLFEEGDELESARADLSEKQEEVKNYADMLFERRRKDLEEQRTGDVKRARFNALGNVLRTMVQPLGWAVGGSVAAPQTYDNRQYIDAFNRAVKASDDIRNVGVKESEFQLGLASEEAKDARARVKMYEAMNIANEKEQAKHDKMMERIEARTEAKQQEIDKRLENDLQKIRLRYSLAARNKKVPKTDKEKFDEEVAQDWRKQMQMYETGKLANQPKSFEEFYKDRARAAGYTVEEKKGGFDTGSTEEASTGTGKKGGFE